MMVRGPAPAAACRRSRRRRRRSSARANADARARRRLLAVQHPHAEDLCRHRPRAGGDARRAGRPRLRDARVYLGSTYVNDFNYLGRTFRVTAQADGAFRAGSARHRQLTRRAATSAAMVPLSAVATFRDLTGPYRVPRYNLYPAAEVQGATLPGFSTGAGASPRWSRSRRETLPHGFGFEWTELALQEKLAGNTRPPDLRRLGGVRLPAAGGAIRELDAAARGHPDRADVPARRASPACCCAAWTEHPGADRLRRADRPCRQERHPDRRVRPAGRGGRGATGARRRSRRRGRGCGRS